jgi:hypothetical protein
MTKTQIAFGEYFEMLEAIGSLEVTGKHYYAWTRVGRRKGWRFRLRDDGRMRIGPKEEVRTEVFTRTGPSLHARVQTTTCTRCSNYYLYKKLDHC